MSEIKVYSLYWDNVPNEIILAQKGVYNKFGIKIEQHKRNQMSHDLWINEIVTKAGNEDLLIFSDIDAIPLKQSALDLAIFYAKSGYIFGLAQTTNHKNNSLHIYAGPMFLAFMKKTWLAAGSPSFEADDTMDCGQRFSLLAEKNGIPIKLLYPTACIKVLWPLADRGVFGIGTFYENEFFHLFESRKKTNIELFYMVANDILTENRLKYDDYIELINRGSKESCNTFYKHANKIIGLLRHWIQPTLTTNRYKS
ncbi:MAG: hypothetical protein EOM90_15610 [Alphaproteobacteria bacterium]|nr:hypothetical protein [Alphaproteobacteria bacterium]